jgi:hypothetical protein
MKSVQLRRDVLLQCACRSGTSLAGRFAMGVADLLGAEPAIRFAACAPSSFSAASISWTPSILNLTFQASAVRLQLGDQPPPQLHRLGQARPIDI